MPDWSDLAKAGKSGADGAQTNVGGAAIDVANAFLASDGDVTATFAPALDALAGFSLALPIPWSLIVAPIAGGAAKGAAGIRRLIELATRGAGLFLPIPVAQKFVAMLQDRWGTAWELAGKDKAAEFAHSQDCPGAVEAAVRAAGLNVEEQTRFAKMIYDLALKAGAKDWQAATVVIYMIEQGFAEKNGGGYAWTMADSLSKQHYGQKLRGQALRDAFLAKAGKAGLQAVNASQIGAGGGIGGALPLAALAIGAALLTR